MKFTWAICTLFFYIFFILLNVCSEHECVRMRSCISVSWRPAVLFQKHNNNVQKLPRSQYRCNIFAHIFAIHLHAFTYEYRFYRRGFPTFGNHLHTRAPVPIRGAKYYYYVSFHWSQHWEYREIGSSFFSRYHCFVIQWLFQGQWETIFMAKVENQLVSIFHSHFVSFCRRANFSIRKHRTTTIPPTCFLYAQIEIG